VGEREDLEGELPLDGRTVETRCGNWTVKVHRLSRESTHTIRTAELTLIGMPSYGLTLRIPREMLVAEHREGDIEWVLDAIREWLLYPDPKGEKSELIFYASQESRHSVSSI
jgi:hypothetical protein